MWILLCPRMYFQNLEESLVYSRQLIFDEGMNELLNKLFWHMWRPISVIYSYLIDVMSWFKFRILSFSC